MAPTLEPEHPKFGQVAGRAVAGVAAAVTVLALTPIIGPVGVAVATGALVPVFEQIAAYDQRAAENAGRAAELGAEFAGLTPEDLADWAKGSPQRLALLANVVEAAWRFTDEEKTVMLARLLADGVQDDARIDIDRLFVAAIRYSVR
ncbi:hypothetical protein OG394_21645 [Kribbella sp. NBC_01245]|uniref:hypothetical protein n=1 Tax=Kribbella sp. NBC_01245 TaxID=2903578 RepID=UPI002E2957CD|nr:hypothetical protein [Kribbella sp. NBC_01245]